MSHVFVHSVARQTHTAHEHIAQHIEKVHFQNKRCLLGDKYSEAVHANKFQTALC